ncbi:hypothetical protein [Pseudescherichia sp.]|uniref:hypothetical protein n=1 Tax=Pseudescherichia sp. TaxID=2055881 RepID=UPI002897E44A|nr:hypothetical protein [Pseudescherichia sp.]
MDKLSDAVLKRLVSDAAKAVQSARKAEAEAKRKHSQAVGELVRRGYVVSMTF